MSKNYKGLTAQQVISVQPMSMPSGGIFYLDHDYDSDSSNTLADLVDLEKAFKQGQTMTMCNFKDGDIVQVVDHNGNIVDTGMYFGKKRINNIYFGKKRINNIHHWLILSEKGLRELNTSNHTLIKTEPIEENK